MTETNWILVEEKLPKYNTPVLITDEYERIVICVYDSEKGWMYQHGGTYDYTVLAWAELPNPYKVEDDGIANKFKKLRIKGCSIISKKDIYKANIRLAPKIKANQRKLAESARLGKDFWVGE